MALSFIFSLLIVFRNVGFDQRNWELLTSISINLIDSDGFFLYILYLKFITVLVFLIFKALNNKIVQMFLIIHIQKLNKLNWTL